VTIEILRQRLLSLGGDAKAIHQKANDEKRDPTPDELDRCDQILAEYKAVEQRLSQAEALADLDRIGEQSRGRPVTGAAGRVLDAQNRMAEFVGDADRVHSGSVVKPPHFAGFGEFAQAVGRASKPGSDFDPRLRPQAAAATTYVNEGSGADGGFLVPTEFSATIERHTHVNEDLLARCNPTPLAGNSMEFPVDETTPWGTTGAQAYWTGEAAAYTESKIAVQMRTISLHKLTVLIPISDEMLEDATALESYITQLAGERIAWKVNDAIVNGNGAGLPQGILGSSCLASQAKEGSQTAATINAANVTKMFGRMVPDSIANAIWLISPDSYNQLPQMIIGDQPVWIPPGAGLQSAPGGSLLGRPVFISMTCQTLGTKGDIYFAAFNRYKAIVKRSGIQNAVSMHLYFDYGLQAFRFTFRMNGNPWLKTAISVPYGSTTLSPFVALDTRA
jgi:HK97 family phage major capsid protein